jgi:beta-glucosidase
MNCREHRETAAMIAEKSIVLLKNENGMLPLSKSIKKLTVIGPNADDPEALIVDYSYLRTIEITIEDIENSKTLGAEGFMPKTDDISIEQNMLPKTSILDP